MTPCPGCNSSALRGPIVRYVAPFNGQNYSLYHCRTCGLEFWTPLAIIREFYEQSADGLYDVLHDDARGAEANMLMFFEQVPLKSGKVLDIGCGNGAFLKEAQDRGFEGVGIEFDSKSAEVCARKGLREIFGGTLDAFRSGRADLAGTFDAVTFFEVLEHQDDLSGFIDAVRWALRRGGYIALSVPNRARLSNFGIKALARLVAAEKLHSLSTHDFPPHHFTWWSPPVLRRFLASRGFGDIEITLLVMERASRAQYYRTMVSKVTAALGAGELSSNALDRLYGVLAMNRFGFHNRMFCCARLLD